MTSIELCSCSQRKQLLIATRREEVVYEEEEKEEEEEEEEEDEGGEKGGGEETRRSRQGAAERPVRNRLDDSGQETGPGFTLSAQIVSMKIAMASTCALLETQLDFQQQTLSA
uniref:Uncharacterized protein n=1 Tax=Vespula pensylvanica TaxID=30213 RepID=A0A834UHG1_VESPE|nr:hypothetical protein H0235_001549 [Vespula pensylvanica]